MNKVAEKDYLRFFYLNFIGLIIIGVGIIYFLGIDVSTFAFLIKVMISGLLVLSYYVIVSQKPEKHEEITSLEINND